VWGSDVPYLQAVDSPGEEEAPRFRETVELSPEAFAARLQSLRPELSLRGSPIKWFGEIRYTVGNGIDVVQIGGTEFKGTELRKLFGLRSTNMRFCVTDEGISVSTLGYGHRVGLSQYGAKAMAEQEQDYTRILCHYYQKAEIKRLFHQEEA
jgi:stage II sporulation protein D